MDELLHHCIRELAFEGDLGCDVNRLQDFITEFYLHNGAKQIVDEAYCAFVWSVVAQHPEVRIGTASRGALEVYIAPQTSKVTKRKKGDQAYDEAEHNNPAGKLEAIEDAALRSLDDLKQEYGDKLRIAVDPERSLVAITGSHIKSSKMTPMVYTALQLISRGREAGLSTVDLSKKTGYDAKTCHYLIDKLAELNLIEKRKKSGLGTNLCIHKYFFERSKTWQDVLAEEERVRQAAIKREEKDDVDFDMDDEASPSSASTSVLGRLAFEPIDSRHLSSLPIVKDRVEKLLRNSPHFMHTLQNLLVVIGFPNPVKSDRRFFQTRLRELVAQGFIERVQVPKHGGKLAACIRLVNPDEQAHTQATPSVIEVVDDEEEQLSLKANITLQKQMIDLAHQSGMEGVTLNQLSQALGSFDKRTLDLQLNRLKDASLPGHIRDLGVIQVTESHGRERRYKYFTFANYQKIVEKEKLASPYPEGFFDDTGGFLPVEEDQFYTTETELFKYVTGQIKSMKGKGKEKANTGAKISTRKAKRKRGDADSEDLSIEDVSAEGETSTSIPPPPPKRKRGRPPKNRPLDTATPVVTATPTDNNTSATSQIVTLPPPSPTPPRKRGRPRKNPPVEPVEKPVPKKRGRPPKNRASVDQTELIIRSYVPPVPQAESSTAQRNAAKSSTFIAGGPAQVPGEIAPTPSATVSPSEDMTVPENREPDVVSQPLVESSLEAPISEAAPSTEPPVQPLEASEATVLGDPGPAESVIDHNKRSAPSTPLSEPPSKRLKASSSVLTSRARTNLSHARREKEILRLITELGGIANTSVKEFIESHTALLERMAAADEAVSVNRPGMKIDKRTLETTLRALMDQGSIKMVTTAVQSRQVKVVHLADKSQEEVNAFLAGLNKSTPAPPNQSSAVRTLDTPLPYGGSKAIKLINPGTEFVVAEPMQPSEPDRPYDLTTLPEAKLREVLLTDPQTVKQLYGFISGKMARLKELHLHVMQLLDVNTNSHVVAAAQQVFHVSYFLEDLPVSVYCALVSSQVPSDELEELLSTPEGRATPLCRLSSSLIDVLEPGKSRARTRMLSLLVMLQDMHIVTPLLPTNSSNPWLRCPPNGDYSTAFDTTNCDGTAPLQSPQYWRFNSSVPIHLWSLDETFPPFWVEAPIRSRADAEDFWRNIQRASLDTHYAKELVAEWEQGGLPPVGVAADIPIRVVRLMRRSLQWRPSYAFSDNQKHVLKRYTDFLTGSTPLEDSDGGEARLEHIANIVCAPREDVTQFYRRKHTKMLDNIEKIHKKASSGHKAEGSKRKTDTDQRADLAQKAAEARAQRERDWDDMLSRVHPEPLENSSVIRIKNLRKRFLQAVGTDHQKWEAEIALAIEQSKIPAKHATANRVPLVSFNPAQPAPPPLPGRSNEKTVEELIALQGPAIIQPEPSVKSRKGKEKEKEGVDGKIIRRRHRFAWTKDYEELARDASAVIRARARECKRLDWSALEQVFRAIPRNTVRQRIVLLRDQPSAEAYFKRLEDKWYELWTKYRGTPELPDDDTTSTWNFDLIAHITFLREHVDKNALRVGFVESTEEVPTAVLPSSISALMAQFEVSEKPLLAPTYDFMWNNAAEEAREKLLAQQPFMLAASSASSAAQGVQTRIYSSERAYVGDAALKMTLSTPNETYNADRAAELLNSAGKEAVDIAMKDMLERGVISKLVRDIKKNKPGRLLKISDPNQNAIGGFIPAELFQDACALEEGLCSSRQNYSLPWRVWPLTASDGDTAALLELVSEGKVDFQIDTSNPQSARAEIDWNSKKADDDDIETTIHLRYRKECTAVNTATFHPTTNVLLSPEINGSNPIAPYGSPLEPESDQTIRVVTTREQVDHVHPLGMSEMGIALTDGHGKTLGGERARCQHEVAAVSEDDVTEGNSLVNCQACLDTEVVRVSSGDELTSRLWAKLVDAGESGVTKQQLKGFSDEPDRELVVDAVIRLVSHKLAFWGGYRDIVLISAHFLTSWTVAIRSQPFFPTRESQEHSNLETQSSPVDMKVTVTKPPLTTFPRRWLDVNGRRISEIWEAACRAVIGIVVFHPGVNQGELRWRLRTVYDRSEIHDILMHLVDCKHLRVMRSESNFIADSPADDTEEKQTFWFLGERRWYDL
ncbi:hypothetical protein BDY19DRAFT_917063 [Irpex rosettiformis]|uniref:Uncharacterized protein n=1 Tax=Irpex rosettiformis TaxID=378272 RepID=A0ACB8ULW9_9APHY|nr:hypothetical protein BDY19DRAFT_917063 [Irpex rosettiformis]